MVEFHLSQEKVALRFECKMQDFVYTACVLQPP